MPYEELDWAARDMYGLPYDLLKPDEQEEVQFWVWEFHYSY